MNNSDWDFKKLEDIKRELLNKKLVDDFIKKYCNTSLLPDKKVECDK